MEIKSTFKNKVCTAAWLDGHCLYWKIGKGYITLDDKFLTSMSQRNFNKDTIIELFKKYGPIWNGENILISKALSLLRGFYITWLLSKGVEEVGEPKQAELLDQLFFSPISKWEEAWEKRWAPYRENAIGVIDSVFDRTINKMKSEANNHYKEHPLLIALNAFKNGTLDVLIKENQQILERTRSEINKSKETITKEQIETLPSGVDLILPPGFDLKPLSSSFEKIFYEGEKGARPKNFKLLLVVSEDNKTAFLPIAGRIKGSWQIFDVPPDFKNWEERKKWLWKQLKHNAVSMLKREVALSLVEYKENIRIDVQPANAFAWAVITTILKKANLCNYCGKPTGGGLYCCPAHKKAAMSTASKQSFLDYVNKQAKRGKLTQEEYGYIKEKLHKAGGLFKEGDSEATLLKKVLRSITKKYPDRDFSFLNGFGSRKKNKEV